jgi:internalin A
MKYKIMRVIVAEKHINLPKRYRKQGVVEIQKSIAVACSAIGLALCGNGLGAYAAETQPGNSGRTFAHWCRTRASLNPEAKHTVEVLLKKAGTTECDAANQKPSTLTEINVNNNEISDIKPLQSLTHLTVLDLYNNKISDIKPLESLTNLSRLNLYNNKISDIKPLESLTNLTVLDWATSNR